jgi:hypothetical protein
MIETLVSLAAITIGLLGVTRALATSMRGSATALRINQGQVRVQQVIEAVRTAPNAAVLNCLVATPASSWGQAGNCEAQCKAALGGAASAQACVFANLAASGRDQDPGHQQYAVVYDPGDPTGPASTFVRQTGGTGRVYDVQITVGWNDETGAATPPTRRVTLRQAVFQ